MNCNIVSGFSITDLNGVSHTLYNGGQQLAYGALQQSSCDNNIANAGMSDGQFTGFIPATNGSGTATTTLLANGSGVPILAIDIYGNTYGFSSGSVGNIQNPAQTGMEDRNGNLITSTDTAGRPLPYLQLTAANGTQQYTVYGLTYTVTTTTTTVNYTPTESSLVIENGAANCNTTAIFGANSATITVISSITLPDNQKYTFHYDPTYGTVDEIDYPGGGWVKYQWGMSPDPEAVSSFPATQAGTGNQMPNACTFEFTTPVILSRTVSFDGTHTAQSQTFSYTTEWNDNDLWTSKTSQVTTTDGVTGNSFLTAYTYAPIGSLGAPPYGTATFYSVSPMEQTVQHFDWGNTETPLETVTKSWYNQFQEACEVHTLNNGESYGHFYTWSYGFISDDKEYDFQTGSTLTSACSPTNPSAPSGPSRETVTAFQQFTSPVNSSLTFARPSEVTVYSDGSEIAQTQYAYDGATITGVSGLTNHDETHFGSAQKTGRGNLTKVTRVCISGTGCSGNIVTTYTYFEDGQLRTATDACGNSTCSDVTGSGHTTTYTYTDNYSSGTPPGQTDAYLTKIQFPTPPDGVALSESFTYSWTPGELTSGTDENGNTTNYTYDSLNRLQETTFPDGGINYLSYSDAAPNPSITTCKLLNTGSTGMMCPIAGAPTGTWTSSTIIMDGMGHTIHSEMTTDPDAPNNVDYVDTSYDGEGRVLTKSNPHWSSSQPTDGTTNFYYDALGRTVAQQQPDGSIVQSCFNDVASVMPPGVGAVCNSHLGSAATGTWVDSTDELGNEWQRTSDSFGNLTEVMEPNGTTQTPSMETDYTYNGFNDLASVVQKGDGSGNRDRSFIYDSFARLIGANNPETAGSVNSPTIGQTSPPILSCSGISGPWTTCYTYDFNGNLTSKIDNRNVTASYCYDNLNRVVQKTYSDGVTPTESFGYDGHAAYTSCTTSGSAISGTTNSKGRLTQSTNNSNAATEYSYDKMGRPSQKSECIPGDCSYDIKLNPAYDLAGDITQLSNGSTAQPVTFSYQYDSAVRLQMLTSSWSGTDHPATLFQANSTSPSDPSYGPAGLLYAQLGIPSGSQTAAVTQTRGYDNRGRITAEAYNASGVYSSAATHSTGVITITPFNASDSSSAQPGTGSVTISGTEQSVQINPCEPHSSCPTTIYDSGTVTVTVNGTQYTTGYGENFTPEILATNLAEVITSGTLVTATANGAVITLTAKTKGASTDYSLSASSATSDPQYFSSPSFDAGTSGSSLTGGSNGDVDTMTATINGCSGSYTWGVSDTASTVASGLKSSIASHCSATVSSTVSGTTITLTSVATGSSTNWPISVMVSNPNQAFFTGVYSGMSGGVNAGTGADLAYSYTIPTGGYDAANNVVTVIDSVMGTWNYTYDTLNRLSTGTNSSGPYVVQNSGALVYGCWTYDGFGNRTMEAATSTVACSNSPTPTYWAHYNTSNQVTGTGLMTSGYTYDAAGDITADGQNVYLYDGAGRICDVKNVTSGAMTQYIYDGEGNRIAKGTLSSWPSACQAPTSANGFTLTVQYVVGLGGEQLSELSATNTWSHTNVFAAGGLLATYEGTDTVFDLTDWQGTKRGETSAAGCLGSWSSQPFGNGLSQSGTCPDASEHHYTGKVRDAETGYSSGNDDFGARYYASSEGRWLSPDWAGAAEAVPYASFGSPQTLNLYAFVGNNPMSRTDPDGHSAYGPQMTCSDGPSGGQCGDGTDPFESRIFNANGIGPGMGCDVDGGEHCTPNMQESSYNDWLQSAQNPAQPLSWSSLSGGQQALVSGGEKAWNSMSADAQDNFAAITNALEQINLSNGATGLSEIQSASMRSDGREMEVTWKDGAAGAFIATGKFSETEHLFTHWGAQVLRQKVGGIGQGMELIFPTQARIESQAHIDYNPLGPSHWHTDNDDVAEHKEVYKQLYGPLPGLIP